MLSRKEVKSSPSYAVDGPNPLNGSLNPEDSAVGVACAEKGAGPPDRRLWFPWLVESME